MNTQQQKDRKLATARKAIETVQEAVERAKEKETLAAQRLASAEDEMGKATKARGDALMKLDTAKAHLAWVESMPVSDPTPES